MTPVASSRPTKSFRRATAYWRGRAPHSTCHSDNSSQHIIIILILYKSFCVLRFHHGGNSQEIYLRKAEDDKTVLLDCDVSTDGLEELVADIGKELEALGIEDPPDQNQLKEQFISAAKKDPHLVDLVLIQGEPLVPPRDGKVEWEGDLFKTTIVKDPSTGKID